MKSTSNQSAGSRAFAVSPGTARVDDDIPIGLEARRPLLATSVRTAMLSGVMLAGVVPAVAAAQRPTAMQASVAPDAGASAPGAGGPTPQPAGLSPAEHEAKVQALADQLVAAAMSDDAMPASLTSPAALSPAAVIEPPPAAAASTSTAPPSYESNATGADPLGKMQPTPGFNNEGGVPATAVASPTAPGRKAAKLTVPAGGERIEVEPDIPDLTQGDDLYFGYDGSLAPDFPVDTGKWQVIQQWKNRAPGSPPVSLTIKDGQFNLEGGFGHPDGPQHTYRVPIGPAVPGKPFKFVTHIKFSSDPKVGAVSVWQDGQLKINGYKPSGGTLYPGQDSYLKMGLYRDPTIGKTGTVYMDDVRVADNYAAAAGSSAGPSPAPTPTPSRTTAPDDAPSRDVPAPSPQRAQAASSPAAASTTATGSSTGDDVHPERRSTVRQASKPTAPSARPASPASATRIPPAQRAAGRSGRGSAFASSLPLTGTDQTGGIGTLPTLLRSMTDVAERGRCGDKPPSA